MSDVLEVKVRVDVGIPQRCKEEDIHSRASRPPPVLCKRCSGEPRKGGPWLPVEKRNPMSRGVIGT